jgi:hypothetical protein
MLRTAVNKPYFFKYPMKWIIWVQGNEITNSCSLEILQSGSQLCMP